MSTPSWTSGDWPRRTAIGRPIAERPSSDRSHEFPRLCCSWSAAGILGCVVIGWDGWRAHLYRRVHPDQRGHGIRRWLLAVAEQRLRSAGAIRFSDAMVLGANQPAHALWSAARCSPQDN
ncbi:MAG: GNAT family N-acetyltransferase [Solirubrobacteraceae bacterium]